MNATRRTPVRGIVERGITAALIAAISAYQLALRPLLIGSCKFHPHCSAYAIEALRRHGPLRGTWLAMKRIGRCRPGAIGGLDPVP